MHDFHNFDQAFLPAAQSRQLALAKTFHLEIFQFLSHQFFNTIKILLPKAFQRLAVLLDLTHIATHRRWISRQNVPQPRIFRQPAQDIFQHCDIVQTMVFLCRRYNRAAAPKNNRSSVVAIRPRQHAK